MRRIRGYSWDQKGQISLNLYDQLSLDLTQSLFWGVLKPNKYVWTMPWHGFIKSYQIHKYFYLALFIWTLCNFLSKKFYKSYFQHYYSFPSMKHKFLLIWTLVFKLLICSPATQAISSVSSNNFTLHTIVLLVIWENFIQKRIVG